MQRRTNYVRLADAWQKNPPMYESYEPKVTLSLQDWNDYVTSGKNTLYGGAIIPGGTEYVPGGVGAGAVYLGHVHQGYYP